MKESHTLSKKNILSLILLIVVFSFLLTSCSDTEKTPRMSDEKLKEIQMTACYSADSSPNCDEILSESEIITSDECCSLFEKCCK